LLEPARSVVANTTGHLSLADVLVVSGLFLRSRSEDRLRKFVGLLHPGWELDTADFAGLLIFLPTRTSQIAARHAFDGEDFRAHNQHRAALELILIPRKRLRKLIDISADQMVVDDVLQKIEPKHRER